MKRDNIIHAIVTLCMGEGQGIALVLEAIH
jgi:acetyl-CoA acetyltransferase